MIIDTYKYTNKGKYSINEDSLLCARDIFAVADGLGGCGNGDKASSCAVNFIKKNYSKCIQNNIYELIRSTNKAVFNIGNGACTTIAAVFIDNNEAHYVNVGDSRVYYFRNGRIIAETKDHSVCQASVDAGIISKDEIRGSKDRSKLFNALGMSENLKLSKPYNAIKYQKKDAFLICSDGFWEYVYENEMEEDLQISRSSKKWAKLMLARHYKRTNNDCDNYSLICGIFQ